MKATPIVTYRVDDAVEVLVYRNGNAGDEVTRYRTRVVRIDDRACTTECGNEWDVLTGYAIGWKAVGQTARITHERFIKNREN